MSARVRTATPELSSLAHVLPQVSTDSSPPAPPAPRRAGSGGRGIAPLVDILSVPLWRNLLIALAGALLINVFFLAIGLQGSLLEDEGVRDMLLGVAIGASMWLSLGYLNSWLTRQVDWLRRPWSSFLTAFASNVVVSVVVLAAIYFVTFVALGDESAGDWARRQHPGIYIGSTLIALLIAAIYQGAFFLGTWKESLLEGERLKTASAAAQFEALNAQLNPHFLFNSLNVLSALVRRDAAQAEAFIQGLSQVYRYVLDVRREALVPVARELDALEAYVGLVQMRFGAERLRVEVDLDAEREAYVVPLVLQMLIENAVKHNGATRRDPLHVRVYTEGDELVVANNRVPRFDRPEGGGLGLDNIRERYRLATGREVGVEALPERFAVRLPIVREAPVGAPLPEAGEVPARRSASPASALP